jgi:hypothetical protein
LLLGPLHMQGQQAHCGPLLGAPNVASLREPVQLRTGRRHCIPLTSNAHGQQPAPILHMGCICSGGMPANPPNAAETTSVDALCRGMRSPCPPGSQPLQVRRCALACLHCSVRSVVTMLVRWEADPYCLYRPTFGGHSRTRHRPSVPGGAHRGGCGEQPPRSQHTASGPPDHALPAGHCVTTTELHCPQCHHG